MPRLLSLVGWHPSDPEGYIDSPRGDSPSHHAPVSVTSLSAVLIQTMHGDKVATGDYRASIVVARITMGRVRQGGGGCERIVALTDTAPA